MESIEKHCKLRYSAFSFHFIRHLHYFYTTISFFTEQTRSQLALKDELRQQGDFLFKHRGWLPIPFVFIGLLIFMERIEDRQGWFDELWLGKEYTFVCLGIGLMGLAIRAITIGATPKNTSGRNTHGQVADDLNTTGVYSIVRHPLYVGNFFMWISIVLLTQDWGFTLSFLLAYWLYYERIMYAEEAFLIEKFGDKYLDWAARTPAFIPDFRKWKSAELTFSVKNILKREYTGLFLLLTIFTLFNAAGNWMLRGEFYPSPVWMIILIIAISSYLILRTLAKYTKVLYVDGR